VSLQLYAGPAAAEEYDLTGWIGIASEVGNSIRKRAPPSARLLQEMRPPCSWTIP